MEDPAAEESPYSAMEDSGDVQNLRQRLREVESKVSLVDTIYGLHQSATRGMKDEHYDEMLARTNPGVSRCERYTGELQFLRNSMFFMQRIRDSYQTLLDFEKNAKRGEEISMENKKNALKSESATQTSVKAFMEGLPAKILYLDWNDFIEDASFDDSILCPVEVAAKEPDPRTILQLTRSFAHRSRHIERTSPIERDEKTTGQRLLPERIKIYSAPLMAIMSQLTNDEMWSTLIGGIIVLLRPYQVLFYYHDQLRERLARLEHDFLGFDGTTAGPGISTDRNESNCDVKGSSQLSRKGSERSLLMAKTVPATEDSAVDVENTVGQGSVDYAVVSPNHEDERSNCDETKSRNGVEDSEDESEDSESEDEESGKLEEKAANSITALIHLRALVDFMDNEMKPKQDYIDSTNCSHVGFHDLWHLFKPGTEVIEQGGKQAYVVLRVELPIHNIEEPWGRWSKSLKDDSEEQPTKDRTGFTFHCVYIDFDGKNFGPVSTTFTIPPFGDVKLITSLPIYPVRLRGQDARQNLINRGRLLLDVADFKAMYYTGATLDKKDEIDSQVVIDFSEALADDERAAAWEPTISPVNTAPASEEDLRCPATCCRHHYIHRGNPIDLKMTTDYIGTLVPDARARSLILSPRSLEDTIGSMDELTETELLVMTYRVFGFVLRSRKWAQLDLNLLRYENAGARDLTIDAFDKLELPNGHRELLQSLVTQHFRNRRSALTKDAQTDLIQGKGKGLIMLLHGAPGVGKTTTAEGIAELFRKPLYQITCGDLGTTAREVEADLEKSFALASRWGCILLLDEADVFLAARSKNDFARNGLVAVFLRVLEYYTGILFLTTNRIGDLDEAFASRIQMSLHYPELDELKTLKVFRLHLDLIEQRFKEQGRTITFDISSVEDFASQHYHDEPYNRWNGRQVRNACHTALALAEFDAQKNGSEISLEIDKSVPVSLQLKYFKIVQKAYLDFGEYLADIQGTEGDDRAYQQHLRARKNTPFEKRSLFDSRPSHPAPGQRRRPAHANSRSSDMSPSFNTKSGSFRDEQYRHQRQYSSAASAQMSGYGNAAAYSQTADDSRDYGSSPTHGQQMHGQQAQMDTRFPMERQQAPPYESPQGEIQPAHPGEAHLHPSLSHDGSPLPHRPAQPQSLHYGYSNGLQADTTRSTTPRVQSDPRDIPHPGCTYRDGAQGGPNRVPYQGGNMPQT